MIVKSLVGQLQNRFHVSAAEIDEQDIHQIIVIGVAAIVPHNALADNQTEEKMADQVSFKERVLNTIIQYAQQYDSFYVIEL